MNTFRRAGWIFLLLLVASLAPWAFVGAAGIEQTRRSLQLTVALAGLAFGADGLELAIAKVLAWRKARSCAVTVRRPTRPRGGDV